MRYQYGEIFKKLGVLGMGRQGSGWAGFDPNGVLVLMTHQNFYKLDKQTNQMYYDAAPVDGLAKSSASAARSLKMLREYFEPGKPILLPIGAFKDDGGLNPDGSIRPADFDYATGSVYRATFREFKYDDGTIICDVIDKFDV